MRVAHVGDSRAYLLDGDGRLEQVTQDHGMGGYITQALGLDRGVEPDLVELETPAGSRLLLCSDGLSNMVDEAGIGSLLGEGDAQQACDALVEAALDPAASTTSRRSSRSSRRRGSERREPARPARPPRPGRSRPAG